MPERQKEGLREKEKEWERMTEKQKRRRQGKSETERINANNFPEYCTSVLYFSLSS